MAAPSGQAVQIAFLQGEHIALWFVARANEGTFSAESGLFSGMQRPEERSIMGRNIFYIIGVIVVVLAILSLVGLA
jgi:hypothetical protein